MHLKEKPFNLGNTFNSVDSARTDSVCRVYALGDFQSNHVVTRASLFPGMVEGMS